VGVSQRTFFRYFRAKDDVAFAWVDAQGDFVGSRLRSRSRSETPYDATRRVLLDLADWHDSQRGEIPFLVRLIFETPSLGGRYMSEHDRWVAEMVRAVSLDQNLDADELLECTALVSACVAAFVTAIKAWTTGDHDQTVRSQVAQAFRALESGVQTAAQPLNAPRLGRHDAARRTTVDDLTPRPAGPVPSPSTADRENSCRTPEADATSTC
jgi:AcrR family transcriptional regulator